MDIELNVTMTIPMDKYISMLDEIERLRAALQFYADDENWKIDAPLDVTSAYFTGGPARSALQQKESE